MRASAGIVEILKGVSFAIEPGDFVGLVGPSGSGKTSLLRLMNRLIEPSSGTIYFEGQDIRRLPVVSLRRQVALVNQDRLLGMSVRAALGYPLRLQKKSSEVIALATEQWCERLKIPDDWLALSEVNLSLQQRRRVVIARTLMSEPKILLLDETPLLQVSQDVGDREFLLAQLAQWAAQGKLTIIMVAGSSQIDVAAQYLNRLLHLDNGRLIDDKSANEINWAKLRQTLDEAAQQAEAEWL
jgi:D-methionine transport system ATP-binding protein